MRTLSVIDTLTPNSARVLSVAELRARLGALPQLPCKNPYCQDFVQDGSINQVFCTTYCRIRYDRQVAALRALLQQINKSIDGSNARTRRTIDPVRRAVLRRLQLHGIDLDPEAAPTSTSPGPPAIQPSAPSPQPAPPGRTQPASPNDLVLRQRHPRDPRDLRRIWARLVDRHAGLEERIRRTDRHRRRRDGTSSGLPDWNDPSQQHLLTELLYAIQDLIGDATAEDGDDAR